MTLAIVCASLAALLHLGFFAMESLLWTTPAARRSFGMSAADAETTKFLAFNQGFYNLFLATGCVVGVVFLATGRVVEGRAIVGFACAVMVGAAAVLATGGKKWLRGVLGQSLPALGALVGLFVL